MGGKDIANLSVDESVDAILKTTNQATFAESGKFIDRHGKEIAY
jgi:hypothetical protein